VSTWALVPLKPATGAKSRLAEVLDADARATLAREMARDVLATLTASPGLAGVALLAPAGEELAQEFGCRSLRDDPALGLNGNLAQALAALAADGAGTVVIVPADVPGIAPAEVATLLAAHGSGVTLVPASRDGGTNALALTPPGAIAPAFGADSARRHREAARAAGRAMTALDLAGFARDIDTPADLLWLCGMPEGAPRTRRYLEASGVCARLRGRG
jgi:2-phospho-L-lactate guanylyltransferase